MKIHTRRHDKYLNIEIEIDHTKHDLGFHDTEQVRELRLMLVEAAEDMIADIEHINRHTYFDY